MSPLKRLLAWTVLLTVASPALADRVRILATDREAAEARVEMVLGAREEVLASTFIFGDDPFTLTSLALLRDAARRGIRVQLLIDAQWNKVPRTVQAHLLAEGIEIREFHPFRLDKLHWVTRRMHDKMAIVDGRELLAGGRNVESTYFGFGRQIKRRNYVDLDLQVQGAAVAEARDYFLKLWSSREVKALRARATPAEVRDAAALLDRQKAWLDARIEAARNDPNRSPPALQEVGPVRFLHDPIGRKGRERGVGHELRDLLDAARESAIVESPYLVPSRAFRASLRRALARGVRVRILTNSLATTDNLWPQAGYVGHKGELVRSGVELWEYRGPECLHSKAAVIDGETVIVGSYNLDPRSERLNTELALVVRDQTLATEMGSILDEHLERAWRIDARGFPEGAEERYPGVAWSKVLKLRLYRLLAPFIKGQL
ncbi:MAG TPA: phosphatidylserine/phosphatidylglycerophosphate/cardiolipin synthase family protein [Thermoanaerobaculia bacterium]|jgi:phosphatidylserine/phosphatidylglycerophosphate/cardiolipin synthase-like enzyme